MKNKSLIFVYIIIVLAIAAVIVWRDRLAGNEIISSDNQETPAENIKAQKDDLIIVDTPLINSTIKSPLVISGQARGNWFFEASFPIVLNDSLGRLVSSTIATAQDDWMTEKFVPFTATLTIPSSFTGQANLILKKDNPSGLPEFDDELIIPVTVEATVISFSVEEVARGLSVPWSLVFPSKDRLLVSERSGAIRIIQNGVLEEKPLATFSEVKTSKGGEEGLMGLALAPDYNTSKLVYACLSYQKDNKFWDKVISFKDDGQSISGQKTIIDNIPAAIYHAGCRLLFGPDNKLYVTTGDSADRQLAQNKNSLAGKILRVNPDGTIPEDNPFPNSLIWTFGHRNPQGLTYDQDHNILWSSEHGPSTFDGPAGGDEINLIVKGKNYGWPLISHEQAKKGLESPIIQFTPALAPGSLLYYSGGALPFFKGNLFFGGLVGEGLYRLILQSDVTKKPKLEKVKEINFGRIREVAQSPDGFIYLTTSNQDGRGQLRDGDDKIYRLVPKS